MALRAMYKGFKKVLAPLIINRPGVLAIDQDALNAELNTVFFPRSEQAVLGAKNLALANRATTQTISLMDFTVNSSDVNVVTVNGTNSAEAWFNYMDIELPEGDYIGSGCTNGSDTTYMLLFVIRNAGNTGDETTIKCFNGDVNITVPSGGRHVRAFIVVRNGKTLTNQIFKLMIRSVTDPDPTYAPFAMTNKELTEKVQGIINAATNAADFAAFKTAIGNL